MLAYLNKYKDISGPHLVVVPKVRTLHLCQCSLWRMAPRK
eukprot:SAG31_NODE_732_length_12494_cov_3.395482_2_plen_40_part_00